MRERRMLLRCIIRYGGKDCNEPYARTCVLVMGSAWQIDNAIARKDGAVQIVASVLSN